LARKSQESEQVRLLREILSELRRLNADLEKMSAPHSTQEIEDADDDPDELDQYE
jgi:hypothetical protein